MSAIVVTDSGSVIPVGRVADFQPRLLRNGVAIDVSAETVTATIRRVGPGAATTLGAAWENMAVTVGNQTYSAANGGVRLQKELLASAFAVPLDPRKWYEYFVEFYVAGIDYSPRKLVFGVTMSARA